MLGLLHVGFLRCWQMAVQDAGDGLPGLAKDLPGPGFCGHRLSFRLESLVQVKFGHFMCLP